MYFPFRGSHFTIWLLGSKHAYHTSERFESCPIFETRYDSKKIDPNFYKTSAIKYLVLSLYKKDQETFCADIWIIMQIYKCGKLSSLI
jgi:hypothetical protein